MKKIILTILISILTTSVFAETSGKFQASGMGAWEVNAMDGGNGNMSITYDGIAGMADVIQTVYFTNQQCTVLVD